MTFQGKHRNMFPRKVVVTHGKRSPDCSVAAEVYLVPPVYHFSRIPGKRVYCTRSDRDCRARWDNCPENLERR